MSVNLSPVAGAAAQFLDNSGNVLTGGKLYTYAAGTTTPQATYTSGTGVTYHTNPIILDAAGRVPAGGEIWLTDGLQYKFVLKDANDVLIGTWDNLIGINSNFLNYYTQQEIQTATAGQTVFTLSTISYTPGTNSLSVFVDGVNQYDGISYAYVETDSTTVTFTSGLHVGALVKFTTAVTLSSGVTTADLVTYAPPFTASVPTTVENKLSQYISVKDFGAVGNGIVDDTTAFQNAILTSVSSGSVIFVPAGNYLITDTLNIPSYTQISGEHTYSIGYSYSVSPKGSIITFAPTTAKSLFVASGTPPFGTFRSAYCLENLAIIGNSTNSTGNSIYAIDADQVIDSLFRNLSVQNFRVGIRVSGSINNRFEFCSVNANYISAIQYDGNTSTTDVWEQCYLSLAPTGVQANGSNLSIRFSNCIFESFDNYGVNLDKECFAWEFDNCYGENIPATVNANGAMFRVGYIGTVSSPSLRITVIGGYYGGNNATPLTGNCFDFDDVSGANITGVFTARYAYSVRTTANTVNGSITVYGLNAIQQTGITTGVANKIQGAFANGILNTGVLGQNSYFKEVNTDTIKALDGNGSQIQLSGAIIRLSPGVGNSVQPATDNVSTFGAPSFRWTTIYATTGTINTSDANQKTDVVDISNVEKCVAVKLKSLMKRFKFKNGDRYHFGVIAQDVKAAFESEGLVAEKYGVFCSDTLEDGSIQLGIRYDELFSFIIGAM